MSKQYKETGHGYFELDFNGVRKIIPDEIMNADYRKMQAEVADGKAVIVEFTVDLEQYKATKKTAINQKTDELIADGIIHNSVQFKINLEKEINALGLKTQRDANVDMTGKKFRADGQTYAFTDTADFDSWFSAAFGRVEQVLIEGSELKDNIDAAVDVAGVDAITDDRT
jgi:hypothetical protein